MSSVAPLSKRLPPPGTTPDPGDLLDRFLDYVRDKGVELYPAQEEAILALFEGQNVILNTPTGSGKSLVATALHFYALASGRRSVYTCPIKALVNEKFLALCADFGPEQVGMATGDATVNRDAPIMCCTAEILANMALREGAAAPVEDIVMDEFHYYSDRDRGVAWQVPLLTLSYARFLLMSATLGDTSVFEEGLTKLTDKPTLVVRSAHRPVPLDFIYSENPLHQAIKDLVFGGKAPVYLVNFTQRECAEEAQNLLSVDVCTKEEKRALAEALAGIKFPSPYGKELQKILRHGVGLHHAGLLPRYRLLVEKLAQQGLLKVICGTDTLGVGVNVPIRTVLFTKLCKYDGEKTTILSVRDFQQISGRAGRKGFDDSGTVVVQAPAHVIENMQLEAKAGGDAKKLRKIVKKKPPERGYVHYDKSTFDKLIQSPPEALQSRFQLNHGMLLNLLSRPEGGCRAAKDLVRASHESDVQKRQHRRKGFQLFRALLQRGIIEIKERQVQVNVSLQDDFSLNQTLSLWLLDTLKLLDAQSPEFALDVLTLCESILENPDLILRKQLDRLKSQRLMELKAEGVEYDERMEELEKVEYPKPLREFIYTTFNSFAADHPWVGQENIRPKAIAREMFETFQTFDEYVRDYDLQRAEGLLLRYLTEVYKVLTQTVPESYRTDEFAEMLAYFGSIVRGVDSSLLDEWERLRRPGFVRAEPARQGDQEADLGDITRDKKTFTAAVRNEVFRFLRLLSLRDYEEAARMLYEQADSWQQDEGVGAWNAEGIEKAAAPFYEDHTAIGTDRRARQPHLLRIAAAEGGQLWQLEQTLTDPDEHDDWLVRFSVDLRQARADGKVRLKLEGLGPIG